MAQRQQNDEEEKVASYSSNESLSKNFANIPDDEIDELLRLIKALSKNLRPKQAGVMKKKQ